MATVWQQLIGWVQTGENLDPSKLKDFHKVGGMGVVLLLYGDDDSGVWNRQNAKRVSQMCSDAGVWLGAWHNGRGEDPDVIAEQAALWHRTIGAQLTFLDLEDAYQGANASKTPLLLREVRSALPAPAQIAVSPKAVDDSMIWNGRTVTPERSCYDLGVRVAPQWYSSYYLPDLAHGPEAQMRFLETQQPGNINFHDPLGPAGRGVPLSFVHPVLEATGVEGSDLRDELQRLAACRAHGFTWGFSVYNLENVPAQDLVLLGERRGSLFLV